jgi:cytochrome c peroxidase
MPEPDRRGDRAPALPALIAPALALALALAPACKQRRHDAPPPPPPADAAAGAMAAMPDGPAAPPGHVVLPPPPAVPPLPAGLPPVPADHVPTPEEIALGQLLFFDSRLAADGTTACVSCHDPANDFSGVEPRSRTAAGKPNLRRTPALVNLGWHRELGWDGRAADRRAFLDSHVAGQLGQPLDVGLGRVLGSATYRAHFDRAASGRDRLDTASGALWAYVDTRYSGGAPWDRYEAGDATAVGADVVEGYKLLNGKAQCATCHAPPLYTDLAYHRLGLIVSPDEGRGRVDPAQTGAFKTPSLRGVATRRPLFHDGSAGTLDDAIRWHLAGGRGQGADPSVIDPVLPMITLAPEEYAALVAFVRALTPASDPALATRPELPDDVPGARP